MTHAAIFDDAFLREKERYSGPFMSDQVWRVYATKDALPGAVFTGTSADCERFIHQRARAAGFAALREAVEQPNRATVGWLCDQMARDTDGI